MTGTVTLATARRVLDQLRHDHRTAALLLVFPTVLMVLLRYVFDAPERFDRIAPALLGIFPFTVMFLVTSVATLRERRSGTLERLMTMPMGRLDFLLGYGLAFGLVALVQVGLVTAVTVGLLVAGRGPQQRQHRRPGGGVAPHRQQEPGQPLAELLPRPVQDQRQHHRGIDREVDRGDEDLLLGPEEVVHQGLVDAGLGGDGADGRAVVAAFAELPAGGVEDLRPGHGRARASSRARHPPPLSRTASAAWRRRGRGPAATPRRRSRCHATTGRAGRRSR